RGKTSLQNGKPGGDRPARSPPVAFGREAAHERSTATTRKGARGCRLCNPRWTGKLLAITMLLYSWTEEDRCRPGGRNLPENGSFVKKQLIVGAFKYGVGFSLLAW